MIAGRPVAARTIFTAFSTASAPLLSSSALAGLGTGASAQRRAQSST